MSTTVNVPTCNYSSYKLKGPYDTDLNISFNSQLLSDFKNRDDSNACSMCRQNMLELGYSSDLYECSNCLGFSNITSPTYPLTSEAWGCDTCATMVAPVSFYESNLNNHSSISLAPADKLEQYLNDLTYRNSVDTAWVSASSCDKGSAVKDICINPLIPNFSINIPPENQGPANPEASEEFPVWAIILIVLVGVGIVVWLGWYFWPWRAGSGTFRIMYGRRGDKLPQVKEVGPQINAEDIENEVPKGHLTRTEGDFLLGK